MGFFSKEESQLTITDELLNMITDSNNDFRGDPEMSERGLLKWNKRMVDLLRSLLKTGETVLDIVVTGMASLQGMLWAATTVFVLTDQRIHIIRIIKGYEYLVKKEIWIVFTKEKWNHPIKKRNKTPGKDAAFLFDILGLLVLK